MFAFSSLSFDSTRLFASVSFPSSLFHSSPLPPPPLRLHTQQRCATRTLHTGHALHKHGHNALYSFASLLPLLLLSSSRHHHVVEFIYTSLRLLLLTCRSVICVVAVQVESERQWRLQLQSSVGHRHRRGNQMRHGGRITRGRGNQRGKRKNQQTNTETTRKRRKQRQWKDGTTGRHAYGDERQWK